MNEESKLFKYFKNKYEQRKQSEHYTPGKGLILFFYNEYKDKEDEALDTRQDFLHIRKLFQETLGPTKGFAHKVVPFPNLTSKEMEEKLEKCCNDENLKDYEFLMIFFSGHGGSTAYAIEGQNDLTSPRCDFFVDKNRETVNTQLLIDYVAEKFQKQMCGKPRILFLNCCRNFTISKEVPSVKRLKLLDPKELSTNDDVAKSLATESGDYCVIRCTLPGQWGWNSRSEGCSEEEEPDPVLGSRAIKVFCDIAGQFGSVKASTLTKMEPIMDFDEIIFETRKRLQDAYWKDFRKLQRNKKKLKDIEKLPEGDEKKEELEDEVNKLGELGLFTGFQVLGNDSYLRKNFYLGSLGGGSAHL